MTNTERKLAEARFFLNQLDPNYVYFDYILSAYLNAARSTTWIMRHEFNRVNGWEKWFDSCEISEKESALLKKINELRIMSTKKTGVKTEYFLIEGLAVEEEHYNTVQKMLNELEEGEKIVLTLYDETETEFYDIEDDDDNSFRLKCRINREDNEFSRESIANLCNDYFIFLEKQVNICVKKFSLH